MALWAGSAAAQTPHRAESVAREETALRETMLAAHNEERRARGVPPLVWNEELAADADRSARLLAAERDPIAAHGKGAGNSPHGENLWAGTRGAFAYAQMAASWLEERVLYVDGRMPDVSRSGNWADVGHYSQMIWSTTRQIGCAVVASATLDLLVCRYDPAGNIAGRSALADLAGR